MNLMRVGLMPAFRIRSRDRDTSPPATSQKLAALRSPGISMSSGERRSAGDTWTWRPSAPTEAPIAASISSVWLRVATGSTTLVRPEAKRPATRSADFTCALATGIT